MLRANQLDVDRAFVLVIDFQETLLPFIGRTIDCGGHDQIVVTGELTDQIRHSAVG